MNKLKDGVFAVGRFALLIFIGIILLVGFSLISTLFWGCGVYVD